MDDNEIAEAHRRLAKGVVGSKWGRQMVNSFGLLGTADWDKNVADAEQAVADLADQFPPPDDVDKAVAVWVKEQKDRIQTVMDRYKLAISNPLLSKALGARMGGTSVKDTLSLIRTFQVQMDALDAAAEES